MGYDLMDVFVKIGADTSELDSGLDGAKGAVSSFASGLGTAAKVGVGAIAAVGTAAVGASAAFVSAAGDVAAYGDNIDKMSQKMGISAQGYQEWEAVMQHSGTSMETMKSSMKTLANAVEKGNASFERIGLSMEEIQGMSNEEIFNATIAGLQNVENETERTYLAGQLLGKGATELGALLNTSAEDTQAMKDRVHELGGVMSDDAVKAAASYQDSLQDMQTAFDGLKRGLVSEFLPSITTVMDGLTELFSGNNGGLVQIKEGIGSFVDNLTEAIPEVLSTGAEIVTSLITAIAENAPQLISAGAETIALLVQGIVENSGTILDSVSNLLDMALEGLENFDWAGEAQKIVDWLTGAFDGGGAMKFLETGAKIVTNIINGLFQAAPVLITGAADLINRFADGLKSNLPKMVASAGELVKKYANYVVQNAPKMLDAGIKLLMSIVDGIIDSIPTLIQTIVELLPKILQLFIEFAPQLLAAGVELIVKLVAGIVKTIPILLNALLDLGKQAIAKVKSIDWIGLGKHVINTIVNGIKALITLMPTALKNIATTAIDWVKSVDWIGLGKKVINTIVNGVKALVTLIPTTLKNIAEDAWKTVSNIDWLGLGQKVINGVVDGIKSLGNIIMDALKSMAEEAWNWVVNFFGGKKKEAKSGETTPNVKNAARPQQVEAGELPDYIGTPKTSSIKMVSNNIDSLTAKNTNIDAETDTYESMADAIVQAFLRANISVECDNREFGRLVRKLGVV